MIYHIRSQFNTKLKNFPCYIPSLVPRVHTHEKKLMANGLNCEYFTLSIEVENKEHKYM